MLSRFSFCSVQVYFESDTHISIESPWRCEKKCTIHRICFQYVQRNLTIITRPVVYYFQKDRRRWGNPMPWKYPRMTRRCACDRLVFGVRIMEPAAVRLRRCFFVKKTSPVFRAGFMHFGSGDSDLQSYPVLQNRP